MLLTFIPLLMNAQFSKIGNRLQNPYQDQYQRFTAGYNHQLEIRNGKLFASGLNTSGQLGNGTNNNSNVSTQIGTEENWTLLTAGEDFSLAIKADGTLWAWGKNERGQLGNGNTENTNVPVQVGTDTDWISVSAGSKHVIALKNDGTLWAWGYNYFGQLGNGTTSGWSQAFPDPAQIGTDTDWTSISTGYNHNLALKANGTLWAWGENTLGQIGDGASSNVTTPTQVAIDSKWRTISAGAFFSTAIKTDGTLWAWGDNYYGQLANGNTTGSSTPVKIGNELYKNIDAGRNHIVALRTDGTVWAWGDELGENNNQATIPTHKPELSGIIQISAGEGYSLALKSNGEIYTWGKNNYGQFANGNTSTTPTQIAAYNGNKSNEIIMVGAGHGFSNAVLYSNGTLKAWGYNSDYNLGLGTDTDELSPVAIPLAENNNISVSTGFGTTLVLKDNGTAWGWGDNGSGAIGTNSGEEYEINPIQIGETNDWISIVAGSFTSAGIKSNGTLWIWGSNFYGEVGDGTKNHAYEPKQVGTNDDRWASISIGGFHTIAVKEDGTLWGWGRNYAGEAGGGANTDDILTPQQIGTENDWVSVSAHTMASYALKADGTLWGWGSASMGQLGQPLPIPSKLTEPKRIGEDLFTQSKLASWSGAAIKSNGELMVWSNFATVFHELGIGDGANHPTPTLLPEHRDIVQVNSGQNHRSILKAQRTDVCMVGRNANGEVGLGTDEISYNTFQCGVAAVTPEEEEEIAVVVTTLENVPAEITTEGGTLQLVATVTPEETNSDVTWSVQSGEEFASVDENGLVTALANGTSVIRATSVEDTSKFGEITINISGYLGNVELNETQFSIYPNPTTDKVFVNSKEKVESIVAISLSGQKVAVAFNGEIDLSNLPKGIYILKIKFENRSTQTVKVIKN